MAEALAWLSGWPRWILAAVIVFEPQTALVEANRAPIDPALIHVLAIGACPPWRDRIKVCAPSVARFVETAEETIGVPPDHITTLIDHEATAASVRATMGKLKDSLPQGSTLIVYYIGHGMLVPSTSGSDGKTEEAFILWSDSRPFAAIQAVQAGIWMTGSQLAGLIDEVPAKDILVILDTCEASGADEAITAETPQIEHEEIALMSSARAHEIAFADLTSATFTRNLLAAIRSKPPTLYDAFVKAQEETSAEAALRCDAAVTSGALAESCTPQDPELIDPNGLTKRIALDRN